MLKSKRIVIGVAVVSTLAISSALIGGGLLADNSKSAGDPKPKNQVVLTQTSSSILPALSTEEIVEMSDLIAEATVSGVSDSFLIEPVGGGDPLFYHDTFFKIDNVIAGSPDYREGSSTEVSVRTEGGSGQLIRAVSNDEPNYKKGEKYLLFLTHVDDGVNYNTEGNHYYVIGISLGAWRLSDDGKIYESSLPVDSGTTSFQKVNVDTDINTIMKKMPISDSGNEMTGSQERIAKIEEDYQSGAITEEGRDEYIRIAELEGSRYSRILSASEQAAWEKATVASMSESGVVSSS